MGCVAGGGTAAHLLQQLQLVLFILVALEDAAEQSCELVTSYIRVRRISAICSDEGHANKAG
jgi:hypothetical protein